MKNKFRALGREGPERKNQGKDEDWSPGESMEKWEAYIWGDVQKAYIWRNWW